MNENHEKRKMGFSRRDFMKLATMGMAAVSIPGLPMMVNAGAISTSGIDHDRIETDVLVIGGGFAGVFAAIKAREKGVNVAMAVKGTVGRSGMTPWGDSFFVFDGSRTEKDRWMETIHANGEYLSNKDYVNLYIDYSSKVYDELVAWNALQDKATTFRKNNGIRYYADGKDCHHRPHCQRKPGGRCGTSMPGLFAAGDAPSSMQCGAIYTSPGVSGIGSCAQGWVAGERAAEYAGMAKKASAPKKLISTLIDNIFTERSREKGYSPAWVTKMLQNIMIPYYVTLVKKEDRLNAALTHIEFLRDHLLPKLKAASTHELHLAHDTKNMVLNATVSSDKCDRPMVGWG